MKTRNSFVSNSSSSSFILGEKEYASVFDLAKAMIPARGWNGKEYSDDYDEEPKYNETEDFDKELVKTIEEAEIRGDEGTV